MSTSGSAVALILNPVRFLESSWFQKAAFMSEIMSSQLFPEFSMLKVSARKQEVEYLNNLLR